MSLSIQKTFLSKLETALGDVAHTLRKPSAPLSGLKKVEATIVLERIRQRTKKDQLALLERLISESRAINLKVVPLKDVDAAGMQIQQLVRTIKAGQGASIRVVAWKHPMIDSLDLDRRFAAISVPVFFTEFYGHADKGSLRESISKATMGVTSADFCLADSATIVLKTRPDHPRSVSLAPPIHVAFIALKQIIADLDELYALLKYDSAQKKEGLTRCMTFITGPSKTADIEAVMVHGVHGPREVYLYVLTG